MAFDEYQKKLEEKYGKKKEDTKSSSSEDKKSSSGQSYDAWKKFSDTESDLMAKYGGGADVDDKYINTFITDANRYLDNSKTSYGVIGYSTASSAYDAQSKTYKELTSRASSISSYLRKNRDKLDAKSYSELMSQLDEITKVMYSTNHAFYDAKRYYSQWETEDDYNRWEKYNGKSYSELSAILKDMDDGEEKDWLSSYASSVDYDEKSKADLNKISDELGKIEAYYAEMKGFTDYLNHPEKYTDEERSAATREYAEMLSAYGSIGKIEEEIQEKKRYLKDATRIQEGLRLGSVNDPNAENYDPEFDKYSGYKSSMSGNFLGQPIYVDQDYETINHLQSDYSVGTRSAQAATMGDTSEQEWINSLLRMNEEEVSIYNYYYAKFGKEEAKRYLDSIQETLNRRIAEENFADLEGNTAMEMLFAAQAGLDQFSSGMVGAMNAIVGDDDYKPPSATQITSGMVREDLGDVDLKWYNFKDGEWDDAKIFGSSLGQVGYDSITTTANMLPSIMTSAALNAIAPGSGSVVGSLILGASAGGNAYQEMINLGYDKNQARAYAALIGGSEAGLQYLLGGIGSLGGKASGDVIAKIVDGIDNAFARTAIKLGGSMLSEGLEEGLQEILTPYFQNLVLHTDNTVSWSEVAYSSLLGALTAGFMEGGGTVSAEVGNYKTGKALQAADISAQRLADIGKTFSADTVAYQLAGRVNENTGAYTLGRLFNEIGASLSEQNVTEITEALVAKGMDSVTARKNAEALAYVVEGGQLTESQIAVIEANDVLAEVARTTLIDANTTWNQRSKGYNDVLKALADEMTSPKATRTNPAQQGEENAHTADTVDVQKENGSESLSEAESVDTSPAVAKSISSIKNGQAIIKLEDGSEVNLKEADLSIDDGMRIETIASIDGISTEDANFVLNTLRANTNASAQMDALGAKEAYKYGFYGFSQDHIAKHGVFANSLTESQRKAIYDTGRSARQKQVDAKQANVASTEKSSAPGKVHFDGNRDSLTERQRVSLTTLEKVAEALGVQIYVFESELNDRGQRVGANGWYDPKDGSIHIDLHSGVQGQDTMLFTAAHELTHFIRQWSPAKFKILADFLMQEYGKKGVDVNALVREQMEKAKRKGRTISYDTAYEEVVADSMEIMLADGNVMNRLEKLKARDKSLWMQIKRFINELADKIRSVYKGLAPDSVEGRYVADMGKTVYRLQELFAEGMVEAGENFQSSLTPGEEGTVVNENGVPVAHATADGTVQLSMRTYEESGRNELKKYLAKCVSSKKLTEAEMQEMIDGIEEIYQTCKEFKDKYAPFSSWSEAAVVRDTYGKPVFSVVTPNGDYKMNLDFSLVCKKRRTLDAVFNEMSKRGIIDNFELGQKSVVKINEIIRRHGFETACALCFVDAKRFRQASMADSFTRLYNELVQSLVPEEQRSNIDHFNFSGYETIKKVADGIHTWDKSKLDFSHIDHVLKTYGDGTVEYKAAQYIKTHAEGRKLLLRGDFMSSKGFDAVKTQNPDVLKLYNSKKGTGGPKAAFGDVQYLNEIIQKARWWTPEKAYEVGGVRIQSFSDYVPRMVFDYVQMVYDLAATKLPAHAYTKEALFVKQFGLTGIKINMSLIPAIVEGGIAPGLDANGNYVWAGESFDYDTAKEIQNAEGYTENCGTICVGVSYEHIVKLLRDPNIRMVIPYHKSGLNPIVAHMNKIAQFHDYTNDQRTKGKDGKALEKDFDFSKALHDMGKNASPKAVADQYLKWCDTHGYTPKFAEFAKEDNYYKLLEDFTLYDKDGNYVPQREVRAVFPTESSAFGSMKSLIKAGLEEDAVIEGKRDSSISSIVDEIQENLPKTEAEIAEDQVEQADRDLEADTKLSDRDSLTPDQQKHFDYNQKQKAIGSALKTLKGSSIKRSTKYGVGKEIGGEIYFHKDYAEDIMPSEVLSQAEHLLEENHPGFEYNCLKYNPKTGVVAFQEAPDFDSAREPVVGDYVSVNTDTGVVKTGHSNYIWHHKWNWVKNDYSGFDVAESWNWSKQWLSTLTEVSDGNGIDRWNTQLDKFGLPHDGEKTVRYSDRVKPIEQTFTSADTSLPKQLPALFTNKNAVFVPGGTNVDIGAGKTPRSEEFLAEMGISYYPFDPYNRSKESNSRTLNWLMEGNRADTVTCANVLNVIDMKAARSNVILEAAKALKPDGTAYFTTYEGATDKNGKKAGDGVARQTGKDTFQNYRKTADYVDEVREWFGNVERKGALIIAKEPKQNLPKATWEVTPGEGTLFSDRGNAPTFYSQMAKVIEGVKQEKLGASSVVSMLRGKGVKAEEIKWSGIEAWLEGKKSVTKAELQEFIAGSMLQIEEQGNDETVRYTREQKLKLDDLSYEHERLWASVDQYWFGLYGDWLPLDVYSTNNGTASIRSKVRQSGESESDSGKKLIQLANEIDEVDRQIEAIASEAKKNSHLTRWKEYSLDGGENYREILFKLPGSSYTNRAMKTHWGTRAMGVLAHARVQDFDVNGKKMLFIEEIQSDWHNEGHSKGYESADYKEAERASDELFEQWRKIRQAMTQYARSTEFNTDPEDVRKKKWDRLRREEEEAYKKRQEADARLESLMKEGKGTVPDAPFRDTYHEFVLKRLIRMAAEDGYDSIGWTTAEVQMDRWNPERLTNAEMGISDTKNLDAVAFEEGYRIEYDQDIRKFLEKQAKKWGSKVGKTTLEKATGKDEYTDSEGFAYSSIKEWYTSVMDSYATKDQDIWEQYIAGQTKVIQVGNTMHIQMKQTGEILEESLHITQDGVQVWSMDITPAMKESVMTDGQPLYSDRILMGSLFSGGGTLEAGLAYQMLDKQFGVEYDGKIASVYADNHGDHIQVGKVEDFDISKYDDIFYLHASPVCHNFSKAKHGAKELAMDIASARATAKHLETAMPQVFTVENAPGYRKSESLKIITDKLTELGYKWDVDVYNSADYGSATSRNRAILRAVKDGELPEKPAKQERTNSWDKVTRDLWGTLPKATLRPSFISAIENTPKLPILDATGKVNVNKPLLILTTNSGHMVTYCWEGEICPTLTTKCGEARLVMPDGNIYAVTPEFMGRIQGLPDDYKYPKEKTRAFTIIGNGIPTHLTKAVVGGVLDSAYEQTHGKALYSDRDTDSVSNRSLLANAFEGVAHNDTEKQKIQEYKGKIDLINAEERKLAELNEKIKELSFSKGPKDTKAIRDLQFEARQTANRINTYDKQLLRLEASKPLQAVLAREKKMAYDRAKQKGKEALDAYREKATKTQRELLERWQESRKKGVDSRHRTAMRHKIKDVVNELNQYLLRGTKDRHVPIELQKAVAEALDAVNMDTVGAEERIAKLQAELMKAKTPEQIQEISRKIDNIQAMGDKMNGRLRKLKEAYDQFVNSDDPLIANSHDEVISNKLQSVIETVGDTPLRDMTLAQLEDVYDMYRMVLTTIRNANKAFKAKKSESISVIANRVMMEVEKVGGKKKLSMKGMDGVKGFVWNNLKPVYAFEHIGSDAFTEVFNNVRAGEDVWAVDVTEAREYYLDKAKKHNYDSWDFKKRYTFTSSSGMEFSLNLEQIMSLYAYSKRDQAAEHLKKGGIVIDETTEITVKNKLGIPVKFNPTEATAYNISDATLADIISKLTDEQKSFADEMQDYLSTVMGAKGNEVSLVMYGVKLFKEKFYFPLKSAQQFMAKAKEQQQGEVKIKNSGFSKETVQKASNPIVLTPFMNVWANHVNEMSMYHAFVLPMEDFYRVYNYKTPTSDTMATESVEMFIQNAYGKGATKYIDQLLKDLNGGARSDSTTGIINKMICLFKKGAVFASLSVVVQQPSAIARAAALVDTKYFIGPKIDHKRHKALWGEVKQYAPVAVIKEMGYFDTNMGKSTQDFILAKEYSSIKEKMKALVTDSGYRDEILSKAPALADEIAWCGIWEAVKRETKAKNPGIDIKSEAFLEKVGERFTEVIVRTQVYDSVLSRSGLMRSKDTGMKMATSFMAEPTTSINMIADALLQGKRGNKKYARNAIGAVIASQILNSILVSFVYAARDDDEDETYAEKYVGTLTGEILDSMNPLTYIPFIKDIVSIVQGYDVERSDMSVIADLWKAYGNLGKDNVSTYRKVEDFAGSIAQIFGLPVKNIMRDVRGIYQTVESFMSGQQTTAAGIGHAITGAVTGKDVSDQQQLYEAYLSGDKTQIARVEGRYKDKTAIQSAIRKGLRENDPRIREAAIAWNANDLDEYMRIAKEIIAEKHFVQDDVVMAIRAEANALSPDDTAGSSGSNGKGLFTAEKFASAIAQGDQATAYAIKTDLIQTHQKNGKTAEEAEKSFNSSAKTELKELYLAGEISEQAVINALTTYCGAEEDDALADVQYWAFKQEYPDVYADDAWFDKYYEEVADSGISIDMYMDYRNQVKDITGEGKKEKRMAVIDSLPLSTAQKDALYYAEGWTASRLYEAPWH